MLLALDWGNSNLRAAVLDGAGRRLRSFESALGAATASQADFPQTLATVRDALDAQTLPALACGAVGAREGWVEAPYVAIPASPDAVAQQLVPVAGANLHIVPGMCSHQPPRAIMRGEETQLVGLGLSDGIVCLPGTHSKWVTLQHGAVCSIHSWMTGALFALLCTHSHLVGEGDADDTTGFAEGLVRAAAEAPLSANLFSLRTDRILGSLPQAQARAALSGLLIGVEVAHAQSLFGVGAVTLCGAPGMNRRYAAALAGLGVTAVQMDGADAAWRGLARIGALAGLSRG